MTLFDLDRLCSYWERNPPSHVSIAMLLAAQTTWKPKPKFEPFKESTPDDLAAFASAMGGGMRVVRRPKP